MSEHEPALGNACCESSAVCIFAKALLARTALCELAARRTLGERDIIECASPVARTNCSTLGALLHERARFALRLPPPGHPVVHAQALRLQCGGLLGLQRALGAEQANVHRMVGAAHERYGSLAEVPWEAIVDVIRAWQSHRPRRATRP
jgi:hypothetical protein